MMLARWMPSGFVRFTFEQIFGLNPLGRLGIEDLIIRTCLRRLEAPSAVLSVSKGAQVAEIRRVSDNLARGSSVVVAATNSFADCAKCNIAYAAPNRSE